MKRFAALVIAILMAAAIMPAFTFADGEGPAVTYSGTVLDFTGKEIGGTDYCYLDVSEYSGMWSGRWLLDYPDEVTEIVQFSVDWAGGIITAVNRTWDEPEDYGDPWSDKPAFVCNPNYLGQTGGQPVGEAGNYYAQCGMYLTSFDFMGLQMGGHMFRFKLRYDRQPYFSECQQDENGYYIEMPITVLVMPDCDLNIVRWRCLKHQREHKSATASLANRKYKVCRDFRVGKFRRRQG